MTDLSLADVYLVATLIDTIRRWGPGVVVGVLVLWAVVGYVMVARRIAAHDDDPDA